MYPTVTKERAGLYRHEPTKLWVTDVPNLQTAISMNGVLLASSVDDAWTWFAGRDLTDFVATFNITTLAELCDAAAVYTVGLTRLTKGKRKIGTTTWSMYKSRTLVDVVKFDRAFGLINGLNAGFGCSRTGDGGPVEGFAAVWGEEADGRCSQPTVLAPDFIGAGNAVFHTGYSWEQHIDQFFSGLPNSDLSDVKARVAKAKSYVLQYLKDREIPASSRGHFHVPLVFKKTGEVFVVPPVTNKVAPDWFGHPGFSFSVLLGSRAAFAGTACGLTIPFRLYRDDSHTDQELVGCVDGVMAFPAVSRPHNVINEVTLALLRPVTHFDDVKIERVLGALSGPRLSPTGEVSLFQGVRAVVSTKDLLNEYLSSIKVNGVALPQRPMASDGVTPMSDGQWAAQAQASYDLPASADLSDVLLTNYDTHGFGLGQLICVCTLAMKPQDANMGAMWTVDPSLAIPHPPEGSPRSFSYGSMPDDFAKPIWQGAKL